MRRVEAIWLGATALLAGAGLMLKLWPDRRSFEVDIPSAQRELQAVLAADGFRIAPEPINGDGRIRATRGRCRLVASVTDDMGQSLALWKEFERHGARLHFRLGERDGPEFPRWRAPIAALWQRQLSRLHIAISRPPVIGLAERGDCSGLPAAIANIRIRLPRAHADPPRPLKKPPDQLLK